MPPADVARAYVVAREVFGLRPLWGAIEGLTLPRRRSGRCRPRRSTACSSSAAGPLERGTAWFLGQRHGGIDIAGLIDAFGPGVARARARPRRPARRHRPPAPRRRTSPSSSASACRPALAERVASLPWFPPLCDIVSIAHAVAVPAAQVGHTYFRIGARFGFDWLRWAAGRISTDKTWNKLAVSAIVDDLYGQQAELTSRVLQARRGRRRQLARRLDRSPPPRRRPRRAAPRRAAGDPRARPRHADRGQPGAEGGWGVKERQKTRTNTDWQDQHGRKRNPLCSSVFVRAQSLFVRVPFLPPCPLRAARYASAFADRINAPPF